MSPHTSPWDLCGDTEPAGGMSHVTEAVRQVQGRGGDKQVGDLDIAFVNGNGGIMSEECALLLGVEP